MPRNDDPMTTEVTPGHIASTDRFGLAFPEHDYLTYDPFGGSDRDADILMSTVRIVRARKEYPCFAGQADGSAHTIKPGDVYRSETALVDRDYWGKYRICVVCMDKWLTEIGRPRAMRSNYQVQRTPAERNE